MLGTASVEPRWLPFDLTPAAQTTHTFNASIHPPHLYRVGRLFLVRPHVVSPLSNLASLPDKTTSGGGGAKPPASKKECRPLSSKHASLGRRQHKAPVTHKRKKTKRARQDHSSSDRVVDPCRGPPGLGWGVLSHRPARGRGGQWRSSVLGRRRQCRGTFILVGGLDGERMWVWVWVCSLCVLT